MRARWWEGAAGREGERRGWGLEFAGDDEVEEGGGFVVGEGPEVDGELEGGGGAGGEARDAVAIVFGFEEGGGEVFETGVVSEEDGVTDRLGDYLLDENEEFIFGGEIDVAAGYDVGGIEMDLFGDELGGGASADGGGGEEAIRSGDVAGVDLLGEVVADFWGGFFPPLVEGTLVVIEGGVGPGGFGVADEGEGFHRGGP